MKTKLFHLLEFGVLPTHTDHLNKRIRLTNLVSVLGLSIAALSLPFDFFSAPNWMVWEDIISIVVFGSIPFLNAKGRNTLSRYLVILFLNSIIIGDAALLGKESGIFIVLFALPSFTFLVFSPREKLPAFGSLAIIVCSYFYLELDGYQRFQNPGLLPSPYHYFIYSSVMAFVGIIYCLIHFHRANERMETALRQSQATFKELVENLDRVFWTIDVKKKRLAYISPNASDIFEISPQILLDKPIEAFFKILAPDSSHLDSLLFSLSTGTYDHKNKMIRSDGTSRWVQTRAFPVRETEQGGSRIVGYSADITEQVEAARLLEERRAQVQYQAKMAAVGEMSSGIAHEIGNPLNAIMLGAGQIQKIVKSPNPEIHHLETLASTVVSTAARISKIIHALRFLARDVSNDPFSRVPIKDIITDLLNLSSARFKHSGIDLRIVPFPEDLTIEARSVEISQVLLNLLNNAYDAVAPLKEKWVEIRISSNDRFAQISVTDSGSGISAGIQEKILQPFFTTKPQGKGTGLGLSVSRGIITNHHGKLYLDTQSSRTRFVVELPIFQEAYKVATQYG